MTPDSSRTLLPLLFINTTRMQDGNPGVVTNLALEPKWFGSRIDVVHTLKDTEDISMASAAILGARFPYLSPAGRIGFDYYVDGGYFDNSGAGVVSELLRGIIDIGERNKAKDSVLYKKIHRLRIKVLHILNSPASPLADDSTNKKVAPIKNDLASPIITIVGAYDMQTTINDDRLRHLIDDIDSNYHVPAKYQKLSLYRDSLKEATYPMNWFMSDHTRKRMQDSLQTHREVNAILHQPNFLPCPKQ